MVRIGSFEEKDQADIFNDYLISVGMKPHILDDEDDTYSVWVEEHDNRDKAKRLLEEFLADKDNRKYREAGKVARAMQRQDNKEKKEDQKQIDKRRSRILYHYKFKPLSITGICFIISILLTLATNFGDRESVLQPLLISESSISAENSNYIQSYDPFDYIIGKGQVWRIITPIFLHFSILHIVFNMMWLVDLGSTLEGRFGSLFFAIMIFVFGSTANLAQYYATGPLHGGMSGVIYGMLGFAWMRGKFDPNSGISLHKQTVIMMIGWFFLCLTGVVGNIGNAAHGVGLGLGMIWGYISAVFRRAR